MLKVEATDLDSTSNGMVDYRLISGGGANSPFSINVNTGSVFTQQILDRENVAEYTVK